MSTDRSTAVRLALERIEIAASILLLKIMYEDTDQAQLKYLVDRVLEHQDEARAALDELVCLDKPDDPPAA